MFVPSSGLRRITDFELQCPDIVDRPHPLAIERRLGDERLSVGPQEAVFDDVIREIVAVVQLVERLVRKVALRILEEDELARFRAERMALAFVLANASGRY